MAVGFGIVGCGMIAGFHARAIESIRGARLVACHDRHPEAAAALAAEWGAAASGELDEFLATPGLDVVVVGTPSGAHLEPAVAAARAGKHVIVEKPLEITLKRCDQIMRPAPIGGQTGDYFPFAISRCSQLVNRRSMPAGSGC